MKNRRLKYREEQRAQTFLEYALLFGIIVTIAMVLAPLIKRGIQSNVKFVADQVGLQQCAEQQGGLKGKVDSVKTYAQQKTQKTRIERVGNLTYQYDDETSFGTTQLINSGFTLE